MKDFRYFVFVGGLSPVNSRYKIKGGSFSKWIRKLLVMFRYERGIGKLEGLQ